MTLESTAASGAGFSIDNIKELMDGLDPAALLPDIENIVDKSALICRIAILVGPIVLLAMGIAYLLLSPKEANHYFGYKTYFGMGSVEAWRFTQKLAGCVLGGLGLLLTVIMLVLSMGFGSMNTMDMVWRALMCLVWECALALAANIAINAVAFFKFDRKGAVRKPKAK